MLRGEWVRRSQFVFAGVERTMGEMKSVCVGGGDGCPCW